MNTPKPKDMPKRKFAKIQQMMDLSPQDIADLTKPKKSSKKDC